MWKPFALDCSQSLAKSNVFIHHKIYDFEHSNQNQISNYVFNSNCSFIFAVFSKAIASSLAQVGWFWLQRKLLKLFKTYMNNNLSRNQHGIADLLDIDESQPIFKRLSEYATLDDFEQHYVVYRELPNAINQVAKNVHSKVIKSLHFDDQPATAVSIFHACYIFLSLSFKTHMCTGRMVPDWPHSKRNFSGSTPGYFFDNYSILLGFFAAKSDLLIFFENDDRFRLTVFSPLRPFPFDPPLELICVHMCI